MKSLTVFGTRPEVIKLAPVVKELEQSKITNIVCITGQHDQMLLPFLKFFNIRYNYNLDIMEPNQGLSDITIKILSGIKGIIKKERPDVVIVQGDTTTSFATALAAFYEKISIAHVEAGLRTYNKYSPFPEEINRKLIDHISDYFFVPTSHNRKNLLAEGIGKDSIFTTGNTIVDAINLIKDTSGFNNVTLNDVVDVDNTKKIILVTAHRRENFGAGLKSICKAVKEVAVTRNDVEIVFPVHLNPNVRHTVFQYLEDIENIHLIEPLGYIELLKLIETSYLILTDSGGIQEESPSFKKPVLILRNTTERPEGIKSGIAELVGTNQNNITKSTFELLDNSRKYDEMKSNENPYGDGLAASRIISILQKSIN